MNLQRVPLVIAKLIYIYIHRKYTIKTNMYQHEKKYKINKT